MRRTATQTFRPVAARSKLVLLSIASVTALLFGSVGCTSLPHSEANRRMPAAAQLPADQPASAPYVQAAQAPATQQYSSGVVTASFGQRCTTCNSPTMGGGCNCSSSNSMSMSGCQSGVCGPDCSTPGQCQPNAQEYIFDGGDQRARVVVQKDWSAEGVNPTDTVAYYETAGGQICVMPSNRVPIYAPRFGAVRQIRGVQLSELAVGTHRILAPIAPGKMEDAELAGNMIQPLAPQGGAQVNALDAFQKNSGGIPIDHVLAWKGMSEARVPFELVELFRTGRLTDVQMPAIGRILDGARTWYTNESIGVILDEQAAVVMKDAKFAKEILVYETEDKCSLRICKASSHTIADSGDTISFTIRFDNTGPHAIKKTVILDSLSPRLEYIQGSAQTSVDAEFTSTPNDVGSSVLKWELTSELGPSEGGVISFDCLVR